MDKFVVRITWEGYGYPMYVKRDPSQHDIAAEDQRGDVILTRHVWDALYLSTEINMIAERSMLRMQMGDDFEGTIEVITR